MNLPWQKMEQLKLYKFFIGIGFMRKKGTFFSLISNNDSGTIQDHLFVFFLFQTCTGWNKIRNKERWECGLWLFCKGQAVRAFWAGRAKISAPGQSVGFCKNHFCVLMGLHTTIGCIHRKVIYSCSFEKSARSFKTLFQKVVLTFNNLNKRQGAPQKSLNTIRALFTLKW